MDEITDGITELEANPFGPVLELVWGGRNLPEAIATTNLEQVSIREVAEEKKDEGEGEGREERSHFCFSSEDGLMDHVFCSR